MLYCVSVCEPFEYRPMNGQNDANRNGSQYLQSHQNTIHIGDDVKTFEK